MVTVKLKIIIHQVIVIYKIHEASLSLNKIVKVILSLLKFSTVLSLSHQEIPPVCVR